MNNTMKTIEVDDELYRYIASQTQHIGESASDILRRLLMLSEPAAPVLVVGRANVLDVPTRPLGSEKDRANSLRSLLISDEFTAESKSISRFMMVLSSLYLADPHSFSEAAAFKGRTRVYFAESEHVLLESGKTTKPKRIPNTPFWVITNTNTDRKRQMVEQLMEKMHFNQDVIDQVGQQI